MRKHQFLAAAMLVGLVVLSGCIPPASRFELPDPCAGVTGYTTVHYEWRYWGKWTWDLTFSNYDVCKVRHLDHTSHEYSQYVYEAYSMSYMERVAEGLSSTQEDDYYKTIENALHFAQGAIQYDDYEAEQKYNYPRYPLETLVDRIGDCEDTAILYASIVRKYGYGALLLHLPQHVAAAVPVHETYANNNAWKCYATGLGTRLVKPYFFRYDGKLYAFAETAIDPGWETLGIYLALGCKIGDDEIDRIWDVQSEQWVDLSELSPVTIPDSHP